ncbi:hypothetical protein [Nocardia cyriacigeorgica]|uniref:hypothetical protein n=1 Tax=Nocardia cyriacigeorgica TaxID=135487 RepID=UPI001E5ACB45|nr:hypothetical protein [Nocardia cyriacigeorgica]
MFSPARIVAIHPGKREIGVVEAEIGQLPGPAARHADEWRQLGQLRTMPHRQPTVPFGSTRPTGLTAARAVFSSSAHDDLPPLVCFGLNDDQCGGRVAIVTADKRHYQQFRSRMSVPGRTVGLANRTRMWGEMDEPTSEPTLTMQDIADLAKVRRPVVSMWRRRTKVRGMVIPFPAAVERVNGVERFRRDEIIEWLELTGRGNNTEHRLDAPGVSVPDAVALESLVALLCLHVYTGRDLSGLTDAECAELAREVDADDRVLARELAALTGGDEARTYIDELVESAFGPADALDRLEGGRAGRALASRDLSAAAFEIFGLIVRTCGDFLNPEGVTLVSAGESPALVLAVTDDRMSLTVTGDSDSARALRRRATIREIDLVVEPPAQRVRVLSLIGMEPDQALEVVDGVLLDLEPDEIAVVIGAAATLCDNMRGEREQKRAQTLRLGNLAFAMRLPRGLWREAHRQALGVWVCRGGAELKLPRLADLGTAPLNALDTDGFAADIVGALSQSESRAYRYARAHPLADILAGGTVVPQGVCADRLRTADPASDIDRIHAATLITAEPLDTFDVLVTAARGAVELRRRSLGELEQRKLLRLHRGRRVDLGKAVDGGTVPVLSADRSTDGVLLDPFDVERDYGRAVRTMPGDVVFQEHPRPRARVDEVGGGLIATPSRVLRLAPEAGIGPHALAALINQLPEHQYEWKAWTVPMLRRDEVERLENVLVGAAGYEYELSRRLEAAAELQRALIDGIGAGTVSLRAPAQVL